ncbi:MAG: hypothetical protein GF392_03945, partial [Candidatus Omnitrophica bacterium]|nr:hypothetical protein [Candidatus Omnitrophota bacterium]
MREEKISTMKKSSGYLQILEVLKPAIKNAGIKARDFILPVILSFVSALCEGVTVALLAPLAKGIADKDFSFIQKVPGLDRVFDMILGGNKLTGMKAVIIITALIVLFSLLKHVLKYGASYLTSVRQSAISRELKIFVFQRLLSFGKLYYDRSSAGYLSAIFTFVGTLPPLLNLVPRMVD